MLRDDAYGIVRDSEKPWLRDAMHACYVGCCPVIGFLSDCQCFGMSSDAKGHPLLDWQEVLSFELHCPTTLAQIILPFSDQCPTISPQILCCCMTLPSVSGFPMKLAQMRDHQIYRASRQMLTLNLSTQQQSRRLGRFVFLLLIMAIILFRYFHERRRSRIDNPFCTHVVLLICFGGGLLQYCVSGRRILIAFSLRVLGPLETTARSKLLLLISIHCLRPKNIT